MQFFRHVAGKYPVFLYYEETSFKGGLCYDIISGNRSTFTFLYSILDTRTIITGMRPHDIVTYMFSIAFKTRRTFFAEFLSQDHPIIPNPGHYLRPMICNMDTGILYIHLIINNLPLFHLRDAENHIQRDHNDHTLAKQFLDIIKKQKALVLAEAKTYRDLF